MATKKYYAYFIPRTGKKGVTDDWQACEKIIKGEHGAKFKGFRTKEMAQEWLSRGADYNVKIVDSALLKGIYFDAGTGRGRGVEISVTDERGKDLLEHVLPKTHINRFGKHWIFRDVTNNYGELLACKYALEIALKTGVKKIFGDSKLVIDYWSKGIIKKSTLPLPSLAPTKKIVTQETVDLAFVVTKLRKEFEGKNGRIYYIPGEKNPADLGFHR